MKTAEKIEQAKQHLANRLTSATNSYSMKTKKWTAALIGVGAACFCISLLLHPFVAREKQVTKSNTHIIRPQQTPLISEQDEKMLKGFMHTMDSIKRVDKSTYDNALKGREGMIDSILFLLKYAGKSIIE